MTTMTNSARPPPEVFANNQRICQRLLDRELGACVSGLVYHFSQFPAALEGSDYDWAEDLLPLCVQEDWRATWEDHLANELIDITQVGEIDDYREACEQAGIDEPFRREAYEHWIVSRWFGQQLAGQGEMVGELFGLTIWGRCTTGQSICLDSVIHSIAQSLGILSGQANEWTF